MEGRCPLEEKPELKPVMEVIGKSFPEAGEGNMGFGSTIFAVKPGDGSAREQAASCQKVLGGWANIANEYATKRYRSNLINWGMLPFLIAPGELPFRNRDYLFFPGIRRAVEEKAEEILAEAGFEGTTLIAGVTFEEDAGDFKTLCRNIMYTPTTLVIDADGNIVGDAIIGVQKDLEKTYTEAINGCLTLLGKEEIEIEE